MNNTEYGINLLSDHKNGRAQLFPAQQTSDSERLQPACTFTNKIIFPLKAHHEPLKDRSQI